MIAASTSLSVHGFILYAQRHGCSQHPGTPFKMVLKMLRVSDKMLS